MLLRLLKSLKRGRTEVSAALPVGPAQRMARLQGAHKRAPTQAHLDILYRDLRIGEHSLTGLVERCLVESQSRSPAAKAFHRPLASYFLAQYFMHAMALDGERAECGVFSGTSALLMCRAAQTLDPGYDGGSLHLIDSFEGLSPAIDEDRFVTPDGGAGVNTRKSVWKDAFGAPIEYAQTALRDFAAVQFHRGWIPAVFAELPESRWSFVHLDVDRYEPTHAGLEYFYPRLVEGGVIICDDYGAPLYPGAQRAWDHYCDTHGVAYIVLDTGQSVILKT